MRQDSFSRTENESIKMIVFDGLEELLNRGYQDLILDLLKVLSTDVQIILFSSTMSLGAIDFANRITHNALRIQTKHEGVPLRGLR